MNKFQAILFIFLGIAVAFGCGGVTSNIDKFTQAQLTALTTRQVDATYEETYHAALDALFDSGFTVEESDHAGGIITGVLRDDRSTERMLLSRHIEDSEFRMSVLIRGRGSNLTSVRLSSSVNGEPYVDEKAIDRFWTMMKRQVLIQAPAPIDNASKWPSDTTK